MVGFLLRGFHFLPVAEPNKHAIQWSGVSTISLLLTKLAVQLANADIGVTAMVVPYPAQFFLRMSVGMLAVGTVWPGRKGFLRAVVQLAPAHEGRFWDMIPAKYKVDIPCLAIQLHGPFFGTHRVGQITLVVFLFLCYNIHGDWDLSLGIVVVTLF